MPEDHFGPDVAVHYDEDSAAMFAPEALDPAVDRLAALAARGVSVCGIELSEAMVAQLRAKPGGDVIPVTIGDMATPGSRASPPHSQETPIGSSA